MGGSKSVPSRLGPNLRKVYLFLVQFVELLPPDKIHLSDYQFSLKLDVIVIAAVLSSIKDIFFA